MSVEQTTQLIQLILNSVLMCVACSLVLGRLGIRHTAIADRLQIANRQYAELLKTGDEMPSRQQRLAQMKKALRCLKRHGIMTYSSLLATNYALLLAIVSTLVVGLRALVDGDWLIILSLGLFLGSVGLLLVGVGLTLLDLHISRLPLWQEFKVMMQIGRQNYFPKVASRSSAPKLPKRVVKPLRRLPASRMRLATAKARVV